MSRLKIKHSSDTFIEYNTCDENTNAPLLIKANLGQTPASPIIHVEKALFLPTTPSIPPFLKPSATKNDHVNVVEIHTKDGKRRKKGMPNFGVRRKRAPFGNSY